MRLQTSVWLAAVALVLAGCNPHAPEGSFVLTQTPAEVSPHPSATVMDVRYPPGSRVVLLTPPFSADTARELSRGMVAAGDPCVSWDGRWVYFAGKRTADADWQIYKVNAGGGTPEQITRMPGGAMDPALGAHDELVFSSPVPEAGRLWTTRNPAVIYGQWPGQPPQRLTFTPESAVGATILRDGRILFVTARPADDRAAPRQLGLFTINNDGTEITAYACQGDGADFIRRPRELDDGRIAFLAARDHEPEPVNRAESVRSAAPFVTRGRLFDFETVGCRSVEQAPDGDLIACFETRGLVGRMITASAAVFRLAPDATSPGTPLFADPQWNSIEASVVAARPEPAGHTSAVKTGATSATLLCLNVNNSSDPAAGGNPAPAAELRVFAPSDAGPPRVLGQVPVAADGSVLVTLPVNVPLGFDTLDAGGNILRHQPPFVWLLPGENRGCAGCHEPRNQSPRNIRPLAVLGEPLHLDAPGQPAATP